MAQHGWALEVELVDTSIAERRHGVTEQCVRSVRVRFRVQLNVRLVRCPCDGLWRLERSGDMPSCNLDRRCVSSLTDSALYRLAYSGAMHLEKHT